MYNLFNDKYISYTRCLQDALSPNHSNQFNFHLVGGLMIKLCRPKVVLYKNKVSYKYYDDIVLTEFVDVIVLTEF